MPDSISAPQPPLPKETKAQRVERLKVEKNPWDAFNEIREFARAGRGSVLPEWAAVYFKWWGVYTQGDSAGVTGGKGGEGLSSAYFMMRIAAPAGQLSAAQLRVIAELTKRHARNIADITVRQNIQLHWLTIESLPEIVDALEQVGLSPKGACGDVVRNVTGCPLANIDGHELFDTSDVAITIANDLIGNAAFYNLPRKFKISVTACPIWCSYPEINDIGYTATMRGKEEGFSVRVGGGLSSDPHLALRLNAWIPKAEALKVTRVITELFRDQQGLRESRDRARMKHLFLKEGWTADSFLADLERRLGYKLDPAVEEIIPGDVLRDHVGIHPQKQAGLSYVGASVLRGRLTGDQLLAAAELSERFGSGQLRTTVTQNLVFIDIETRRAAQLVEELTKTGLLVEGSPFWRGAVACTGTEFCKLAITETKGFTRWLVDELEESAPGFDQQLKLHVTGCPNSCGQHWIADIGLEGKKIKHEGKLVDAYYFCVGGAVGLHAQVARPVGYRIPATEVPQAITRLLETYQGKRRGEGESLRAYFARHTNDELRAQLAGEMVAPVARDVSAGPSPGTDI
jgi:sulfite reductase (ferredoxin)